MHRLPRLLAALSLLAFLPTPSEAQGDNYPDGQIGFSLISYASRRATITIVNQNISRVVEPRGQGSVVALPFRISDVSSTGYYRLRVEADNRTEFDMVVTARHTGGRNGTYRCSTERSEVNLGNATLSSMSPLPRGCSFTVTLNR